MTEKSNTETEKFVIFMPSGRRGRVPAGQTLLDVARQMGVEIESICGGRLTCGKCKVHIENGRYQKMNIDSSPAHLSPMGDAERDLLERLGSPEYRLACAAEILGDVLVTVPEESRAQKQVIRKAATERAIEVAPAIRQVYVEIDRAVLGDHRSDWGRLQEVLHNEWDLNNLTIDLLALRKLQAAIREGDWAVTVILWQEREVIDVAPGYQEGIYGLAVDIGTTTVAGYLCDLRTGELLATESVMNPQVPYGDDLMSRVSYASGERNGLKTLHEAIIKELNRLAARAAREAGIQTRDIHEAVMVGNTTMTHILLGINPVQLGETPFALANRDATNVKARELNLHFHPGANLHVLPSEAGHVGSDNVAVLLAEEPHHAEETILVVDIGTNGEIALGNREWLYSASSPTGPAFEGAQITFGMRAAPGAIERVRIDPVTKQARVRVIGEERWSDTWQTGPDAPPEGQPAHLASGICGSGIIEAVAEMHLAGIILDSGRFNRDLDTDRIRWNGRKGEYILVDGQFTSSGKPLVVTQDDVRNVQLAKGALYAGAKLLMNEAGVDAVDRVVLAGAFGSYIDPKHALALGLIPDCPLDRIHAVGNAAGDGARIALLNRERRAEAGLISKTARYIETAANLEFQTVFVEAMTIPHQSDPFPNLEAILAAEKAELKVKKE